MRAGLKLVPVSFTGESEGVAVDDVGVSGVPVELILPEERQQAMDRVKAAYPGLVVIDFTLPTAVNGAADAGVATCGACQGISGCRARCADVWSLGVFAGRQGDAALQAASRCVHPGRMPPCQCNVIFTD